MKNYTGFIALAAIAALPACSNYHYGQNDNGSYQYQESQYPSQNDSEFYATAPGNHMNGRMNSMEENRYGDHKDWMEWKEEKINEMADHFFDKADANHDGYISWPEFEQYMHQKFREADTDHDGKLSHDEVVAMLRRHMERIHEMREEKRSMYHEGYDNDNDQSGDQEQPPRYNGQE